MYKVLVIDDQPSAVKHICLIIEKKCPEFEVVATAENGEEGFGKIVLLQPDIVISDVKMPLLNGIELAKKVKQVYPDIEIIIVSGHQDFEYTRGAIQSGVTDYILKPIVPANLQYLLFELSKKIKERFYQKRNKLIHQICNGVACDERDIIKYFSHEQYYSALVRKNGLPRRFIYDSSMEIYSNLNEVMTIYGRDEMEALYIVPKVTLFGQTFKAYISKLHNRSDLDNGYVTTVYCDHSFNVLEIQNHIKSLYVALDTYSSVGISQKLNLKMLPDKIDVKIDHSEIVDAVNLVEHLLGQQQQSSLKKEIKRIFTEWSQELKSQLWLEHAARQILYTIRKTTSQTSALIEDERMLEDAFYYAITIEDLIESINEIMFKFIVEPQNGGKVDTPEFFSSIKEYMVKHSSEPITLQDVCLNFSISQTYLSKLFRKYENQSFNRYFTGIRMEKAIELMQGNGELFVKDVAAIVGYNDQFYFSRIFRAYTGVCPSEYLESLLE